MLPSGWEWRTIPDLVREDGVFIDGDWVESKDQDPNGDVRLIQLADVGDGVYRDKSDRFMTKAKAEELRCTFLKDGDVLIARMPDPLGRACIFPGDAKPSVTVVDVAVVRSANGEFDHRWLACFVNAHPFRSAISGLQAGSTRKRISRGNLATIPLPVPPLPEQRRIVAEIEKQFARLEMGVTALRRVQANLKRYRAAVLKAACEGRLVPTEAELATTGNPKAKFETGESLLARILVERRKNWKSRGKYKEPTAPVTAGLPPLPEGWVWATFEQIAERVTVGFVGSMKHEYVKYGVPFLRGQNVRENRFDPEGLLYVSADFHQKLSKSAIQPGDLAVVRSGSVGVTCVIPDSLSDANCSDLVLIQRPLGFVPQYGAYYMNSLAKRHVAAGKVGVALIHFNTKSVAALAVPLPPLVEQKRIVAEVERRLSVVEELEAVVSANLQRATRLRQSILQKAFSGKLTKP